MRADECRSLPWVDRGGAHLDPGGLFLQPKGDAAIPIAPAAAVHGLDHDLLREIGDRGVAFARPAAGSLQVVHCRYPPRTASTHGSSGFTCRHQLGIAFGCTRVMASLLLRRHVAHLRPAGKGWRAGQGEQRVGPDGRVAVHSLPVDAHAEKSVGRGARLSQLAAAWSRSSAHARPDRYRGEP